MIEIEKPTIECVYSKEDPNYGKFIVEPLERGYGTTLGNALRRIMLSSMPGSAIVAVKIDGVMHELQTIDGVVEDVTEIILNLKTIIFTIPLLLFLMVFIIPSKGLNVHFQHSLYLLFLFRMAVILLEQHKNRTIKLQSNNPCLFFTKQAILCQRQKCFPLLSYCPYNKGFTIQIRNVPAHKHFPH